MNNQIIAMQIGKDILISFHHKEFSGYVGESHYVTECYETNFKTLETKELSYMEVKAIYNSMEGFCKAQRIEFWRNMNHMSPKAIQEECERSTTEAISRVI